MHKLARLALITALAVGTATADAGMLPTATTLGKANGSPWDGDPALAGAASVLFATGGNSSVCNVAADAFGSFEECQGRLPPGPGDPDNQRGIQMVTHKPPSAARSPIPPRVV